MLNMKNFETLYGDECVQQSERAHRLLSEFASRFGREASAVISAPGRSEIVGNHTDHQNGCVVAAAINADIMAAADTRDDLSVNIYSVGFGTISLVLDDLSPRPEEAGTSEALIRGMAFAVREKGLKTGGFDAVIESTVDVGSGLSSSAAFENLAAGLFSHLYNDGAIEPVDMALMSRFSENSYFMKPCGLEDQLASALGGISFIDFEKTLEPSYEALKTDFGEFGHTLIITNAGASHADLTDDYAAITREMYAVAEYFGKPSLRGVDEKEFYASVGKLRERFSDRALLRCHHFFEENARPQRAIDSLRRGDFDGFLKELNESGLSSSLYLQNLYPAKDPSSQSLNIALMTAKKLLGGRGSARVHGGGFAGTIACIVPAGMKDDFISGMNAVFGEGSAREYRIRKYGVFRLM